MRKDMSPEPCKCDKPWRNDDQCVRCGRALVVAKRKLPA